MRYSHIAPALGLFGILLAAGCQPVTPAVDLAAEEQAVRTVLDNYVTSVENEDMTLYAQVMAHDASMVNFGAFGDPIVGWDAVQEVIEGQNAALDSIQIDPSQVAVHVSPDGDRAWATSLWRFQAEMGESSLDLPVRCTWVLEKRDGAWIIVHWHKSVPAG